jgi:dCMP deaminase
MPTEMSKWHKRYINLAKETSTWSKDPSRKIGAVIVGEHGQILSQGYNGFPRGVFDLPDRYDDRPTKYKYVVHAEMNAIYNATLNGVKCHGSSLYVWGLPVCSECAKGIIQVGIKHVYIPKSVFGVNAMWDEAFEFSKSMFAEAGVGVYVIED